ncbi:uncharacterized protein T551_01776 [Pneumocystis jirovecii RU7]|uniref:EVE domain-containing protein n=1 Tax=Pneumocystis jirovecii (strain RU7) TaxID=1408657 RepID=A0A0W4ZQ43_PNEJ7|nr:uncharacterized protein T551_01776 [Pneumocystis jirovecii RU7]KTW30493.1 hypothetical protein T551_01776 [Pneumocystis jirovecii RU7]
MKTEENQESPRKKARTGNNRPNDVDRLPDEKRFWLMKAEPESRMVKGQDVKFSIDDLKEINISPWDGVRNAEACITMRYKMKVGDLAFFYHSNCEVPGIAGIMEICKEGYPDYTAWDPSEPYYDSRSTKEKPRWYMVDVKYLRHFSRFIPLRELKKYKEGPLKNMALLRRPQLSVQPVTVDEWNFIMGLEKETTN